MINQLDLMWIAVGSIIGYPIGSMLGHLLFDIEEKKRNESRK